MWVCTCTYICTYYRHAMHTSHWAMYIAMGCKHLQHIAFHCVHDYVRVNNLCAKHEIQCICMHLNRNMHTILYINTYMYIISILMCVCTCTCIWTYYRRAMHASHWAMYIAMGCKHLQHIAFHRDYARANNLCAKHFGL